MNIYVSNLGDQVTNESLRAMFATYGEVNSYEIVLDLFTGKSRGFAFVEMKDLTQATAAITRINGSIVNGRAIVAKEADRKPEHKGSYAVGRRSGK